MKQIAVLLFTFFLSAALLAQEPISVSVIAPAKVVAGQKFKVILEIQNRGAGGFARFVQTLPNGFSAFENSGQTAQFSFQNQNLELSWLRLGNQKVLYEYTLQVADTLNGVFQLPASFNYQHNNKVAHILLKNQVVRVQTLNQYLAEEKSTENIENLVIVPENKSIPAVNIKRQKSLMDTLNQKITVTIVIQNSNYYQKALLNERIAAELDAKPILTSGAVFKQDGANLYFEWEKLPLTETKVIYELCPKAGNANILTEISGLLTLENQGSRNDLQVFDPDQNMLVFHSNVKSNKAENVLAMEEKPVEEKKVTALAQVAKNASASSGNTSLGAKITSSLKKANEVNYKIQIAAFSNPVPETYFKNMNISIPVSKEQHNGLYKYTIGEFKTYVEAEAYKEHLLKNTKLQSAFITAYKKEDRIEVKDALKKTKK